MIHSEDPAVGSDPVQADRGVLEEIRQFLLTLTQRFFGRAPQPGQLQLRADARQQLAGAERLDEVIVSAGP